MIVASRKPFEEIKKSVTAYKSILVVGCGTCVAVCLAGGKKEVGLLASQLKMSFGLDKKQVRIFRRNPWNGNVTGSFWKQFENR